MRIVIIGAGAVGSTIAATLATDHDIVIVDIDPERVDSLTYSLDCLALTGDGTSLAVLQKAGIDDADMVIACTDDDETNLVVCLTAKTVDDPFTIARTKDVGYLDTWNRANGAFGVDFLVCTYLLTAEAIVRVLGLPAARNVNQFAGGLVQMAEFTVDATSWLAGRTVREADRFDSLTFAAVIRENDIDIPSGETVIRAGDRIVVISTPASLLAFAQSLAPDETAVVAEDVLILGGSAIGAHTATLLEQRGLRPRLVERDPDRARTLAEDLHETTVFRHDASDIDFLREQHVDRADAVVAALDTDEQNLLMALLAKKLGAKRAIAVVESGAYTELFEEVGIDVAVNPRDTTAEEIIRFTKEGAVENMVLIESDRAEVLEVEVSDESVLADRSIQESMMDLPDGMVIGAITRDGAFITPRGETVARPGDHVVVFVDAAVVDEVESIL